MVTLSGRSHLTFKFAFVSKNLEKARIHIEDIVWNSNSWTRLQLLFAILYRRKVPIPSFFFRFFYSCNLIISDSGCTTGDAKFLEAYMMPEKGKCFVDVGAYRGMWSMFVARSGVEVHAFEPSPIPYAVLAEKVKKYPNLHTYQCALGGKDSIVKLSLTPFSLLGRITEKSGISEKNTADAVIRTLDGLKIEEVGVIKVDTEGYEVPILMGAKDTILKNRPRLIIEVHKGTGDALPDFSEELHRVENILRDFGYSCTVLYRRFNGNDLQPFIIGNPDVLAEPQSYQDVTVYGVNSSAEELEISS
jgi:FkbM family methyltransferase